jgi:hypothetical protein
VKPELRRRSFRKPLTRVQLAILSDRLKFSEEEAEQTVARIGENFAKILGITETSIETDFEFSGRELDLIFTINKQNTPTKK